MLIVADPAEAVKVITLVPLFRPAPESKVVVVEPGSVMDLVPPATVILLKVFAPVIMTAPVPPPEIARLLYVLPPPANVLVEADVSVKVVVPLSVRVKFVAVATVQTVPVLVKDMFPLLVIFLAFELDELKIGKDVLNPPSLKVPLFKVKVPVQVKASCRVKVLPNMTIVIAPKLFPALVKV